MLLLDHTGEIANRWTEVAEEAALPDGPVILPLSRIAEAEGRPETGVHLPNTADPRPLPPHFPHLALISVAFPSFADGRGFSIARCLREIGYTGRLRASGPVIADQFGYLLECGFDEVWLPESVAKRQPAADWLDRLGAVSLSYQRGREGRASILDRRRAASGR
ncbi:MAG: DUF934 domain-containing protein [Pseudomonadota bacterium]